MHVLWRTIAKEPMRKLLAIIKVFAGVSSSFLVEHIL